MAWLFQPVYFGRSSILWMDTAKDDGVCRCPPLLLDLTNCRSCVIPHLPVHGVSFFCLPGFSLFMMWSECFPQHISSILSFYAGTFTLAVFSWLLQEERISKGKENLYIFYALVLQVLSLLNYQGMALCFILPGF